MPRAPRPRLLGLVLLALLAAAGARAEAPPAQVTLPLPTYEELRKRDERPSLTVVESLRISGSFQRRELTLTLSGRATGHLPSVDVLEQSQSGGGVNLHGCEGDALLSHGEGDAQGGFQLTPLKPSFSVRCRLAPRGSDRLELRVKPSVLYVDAQVEDGEFVQSDAEGQERVYSVVRLTGAPSEALRPSATARYRLSLYPDETRFRYQFDVRNPNRSTQPFVLWLRNNEVVQQVDAQARYEIDREARGAAAGDHPGAVSDKGPRYRFELPPGERTLVLTGTLSGQRFQPPVSASVQYVLLESHPLLRPQPSGAARRISSAETRITAEFRGAQAFLLGEKEELRWQVTRLAALRTTSFAVRSAEHRFFLAADGRVLGESALNLDNQGAPDLTLPMKAPMEPTFASLRGEAVFLTRNEAGQLWLPISQGDQTVLVQHRQALSGRLGVAGGALYLPQLSASASQASVELRFPREWRPLYAELAPEYQLLAFSGADVILWLLLLLWVERCLAGLGLARRPRLRLLAIVAPAAALSDPAVFGLVVAALALSALYVLPALRRVSRGWLVLGAVGAGGLFLMTLVSLGGARMMKQPSGGYSKVASDSWSGPSSSANLRNAAEAPPKPDGKPAPDPGAPQVVEGLPAKFVMPYGERQVSFHREMLNTEAPRAARVVLLARRTEAALETTALVLALLGLIFLRRQLAQGAAALWQRALAPLPSAPPSPPAS